MLWRTVVLLHDIMGWFWWVEPTFFLRALCPAFNFSFAFFAFSFLMRAAGCRALLCQVVYFLRGF